MSVEHEEVNIPYFRAARDELLLAFEDPARVRVAAGTLYHLTGRQPRARFLNESFQTRRLLRRELARHGLSIEREQTNTNPHTPAFVIFKRER